MNILINGKKADITLEHEKTVGEILAGLSDWLSHSGFRLSGLVMDGQRIDSGSLENAMGRELSGVKSLDIATSSLSDLSAESLARLLQDADDYGKLDFGEKRAFAQTWEESPQARLLAEQLPEIFTLSTKTFSGEGLSPAMLRAIAEERLRELEDPAGELGKAAPVVDEICRRLADLPLDIQTGKDSRAVETVRIFSNITEKIFRLFHVLKAEGFSPENIPVEGLAAGDYIGEFSAALKELLAAYEQKDAVLVGDLAEYELAPRLQHLYSAIREGIPAAMPA
jgi:hypothetical protein